MSTYSDIQNFIASMRRPTRVELLTNLGEPQRRIVRLVKARASLLEEIESEFEELDRAERLNTHRRFA